MFLCDRCATRLQKKCLNGRPPIYCGLPVNGYCGLCNRHTRTLLRQWFICPICLNVILGYTKGFAASRYLRSFWASKIRRRFPSFRLKETEVVRIEPFVPGRRSQRAKAQSLSVLDFEVVDDRHSRTKPIFYIELKTGPGSIENMKKFQLDLNDWNDVATVCNKYGLPAYFFHAKVNEEYLGPTRRSLAKGLWWTDCFTLDRNRKSIQPRRGEDKYAAYYRATAFRPKADFLEELGTHGYESLRRRLKKRPLRRVTPQTYTIRGKGQTKKKH